MIKLFDVPTHKIYTETIGNLLHGDIVTEFENNFKKYVGAKYAVSFNSATSAIFLALLNKHAIVKIPSIIPPVVANSILNAGCGIRFKDDVSWIGDSYVLHDFGKYKIIDSAQAVRKNQFKKEANANDLMVFSFYPTKPISSCDGGMIVSNDKKKIEALRKMSFNGMSSEKNNWERKIETVGYKMYMNSIQAYIANENLKNISTKNIILKHYRENYYNFDLNLNNKSEHLYLVPISGDRKKFIQKMKDNGIMCGIHYEPLHKQSLYQRRAHFMSITNLKKSNSFNCVSIPYHAQLSLLEVKHIVEQVKKHR